MKLHIFGFAGLVRSVFTILAVGLSLVLASESSIAGFVGSLAVDTGIVSFGENGPAYYAQSFVAPNGTLDSVTILLSSANGGTSGPDHHFRVLITGTEPFSVPGTGSTIRPTAVLFESDAQFLADDRTGRFNELDFTAFTIDLGGLALTDGLTYAIVLDAFSEFDGVPDFMGAAISNNAYSGGNFFYMGGPLTGTRQSDFASDGWNSYGGIDLSFEIAFTPSVASPVPEPASLAMWGLGAIGMMAAGRRKRK